MPFTYKVKYSTNGSTFTALTDVQNITVRVGRNEQLAAYNASTASVEIRYPTGYASPIAAMVTGTYLKIESPNWVDSSGGCFLGRIKDVHVTYGIPYSGGVGNEDYLSITAEGFFAAVSRMSGESYAMASGAPQTQLTTAQGLNGTTSVYYRPSGTDPVLAATTISGTWGDWYNQVLTTINGRMWDTNLINEVDVISPFYQNPIGISSDDVPVFSDTPLTNQFSYDQLEFTSYGDNFWNQADITPEGLPSVTVTAAGATTPYRTYSINTLNSSAGQATDYGQYLTSLYGSPEFRISSISCFMEATTRNQKLDVLADQSPATYPGMRVKVVFRGTTYQSIIEGFTVSASPESSRYTFYLSAAEQNNYLVLDNAIFGRLDFNKLGY